MKLNDKLKRLGVVIVGAGILSLICIENYNRINQENKQAVAKAHDNHLFYAFDRNTNGFIDEIIEQVGSVRYHIKTNNLRFNSLMQNYFPDYKSEGRE